ncbi:MAG: hypothetical protein K8I30_17975, partial [Anaerolineae bacterium]|nr:hypothetical protein [Anaerolineae bacterium]
VQADGDLRTSVGMRLPPGAAFEDVSNGRYVMSADGTQILDTAPVVPGESHLMHLAYTLPYSSGRAAVNQTLDYPLEGSVEVLVDGEGVTLASADLPSLGPRTMGDRAYNSYGAELSLPAGTPLTYEISGSPAATVANSGAASSVHPIAYVLIGAGTSAILIAGVLLWRERRAAPRASSARSEINALMQQITDLDAQHEKGEVSEKSYQKRRSTLKAKLAALMKTEQRD